MPKNAFYGRSSDSSLREFLTREFESIVWLYKLAPATLNVEDGEYVHEIDVFYCRMKENEYSIKPFSVMDELLPRHTVFIIEYGEKFDLLMHHKEISVVHGEQKWKCGVSEIQRDIRINADTLNIQGQSMDVVYNGLLSQISGLSASTKEEYKEQVDLRKQLESIQKQFMTAVKEQRYADAAMMLHEMKTDDPFAQPELLDNEQLKSVLQRLKAFPIYDYTISDCIFKEAFDNEVRCKVVLFPKTDKEDMRPNATTWYFKPVRYLGEWKLCFRSSAQGDRTFHSSAQ